MLHSRRKSTAAMSLPVHQQSVDLELPGFSSCCYCHSTLALKFLRHSPYGNLRVRLSTQLCFQRTFMALEIAGLSKT